MRSLLHFGRSVRGIPDCAHLQRRDSPSHRGHDKGQTPHRVQRRGEHPASRAVDRAAGGAMMTRPLDHVPAQARLPIDLTSLGDAFGATGMS